jgi:RimJ/RimL family protein N-acetyltransferase
VLPTPTNPDPGKTYRIVYAVHELLNTETESLDKGDAPSRFIGLITLRSQIPRNLPEAEHLYPPSARSPSVLTVELGYLFLPSSWSRGFATESLAAVIAAYRAVPMGFWAPFEKVYCQAIVDAGNAASLKVMQKSALESLGVHVWEGEPAWMAGEMRGRMELAIWGCWVVR